MKTKADFKELNFNEIAFFLNVEATKAKAMVSAALKIPPDPKTKKPKVKISDLVPRKDVPTAIRSSSALDGKCIIDIVVDAYNKGVTPGQLREWSQEEKYIKAIGFAGKNSVINEILHEDQLHILQQSWLYDSCYGKRFAPKNAQKFIDANPWAAVYLQDEKGIRLTLNTAKND